MITKLELIEYLKHTPENTNYNILYSSLYNGSNKEAVDEFIEALSRGNLSLAALQPYLAKLYEDDKTISPDPLPPFSSGGGVQPDWNQNDSTAPNHVKNRPFYTGDPVETVVIEESTVSFADNEGIYAAELPAAFVATVGNTYTVYWDGTAYECVCGEFETVLLLGNLSIIEAGSDTGEPFIMNIYNSQGIDIYTKDTSASHTISISEFASEIVKIDRKYLPFLPKPNGESYLTFSSPNSFTLKLVGKHWDGTLEYFSSDGTWTVLDGDQVLSAEINGAEYVMYLRGTGNTVITGESGLSLFLDGFDIACIGNIETLLDYATVESGEHPTMANYCYKGMFANWTSLTQAPNLPATTLAHGCYQGMFVGCTGLRQAPELPATTLAGHCYRGMFVGCTGLRQAPELPATILVNFCYERMFEGCTSLTHIPELPATTLADYCYHSMFSECTSLKLSETRTGEYTQEYRIPFSGDGTTVKWALDNMFAATGGTFTGAPEINKTYYLSSDNMIVRGNEIATLNGYVKNMINSAEYIIPSSTPNSTKKFKITVDDSGAISATEVT